MPTVKEMKREAGTTSWFSGPTVLSLDPSASFGIEPEQG